MNTKEKFAKMAENIASGIYNPVRNMYNIYVKFEDIEDKKRFSFNRNVFKFTSTYLEERNNIYINTDERKTAEYLLNKLDEYLPYNLDYLSEFMNGVISIYQKYDHNSKEIKNVKLNEKWIDWLPKSTRRKEYGFTFDYKIPVPYRSLNGDEYNPNIMIELFLREHKETKEIMVYAAVKVPLSRSKSERYIILLSDNTELVNSDYIDYLLKILDEAFDRHHTNEILKYIGRKDNKGLKYSNLTAEEKEQYRTLAMMMAI